MNLISFGSAAADDDAAPTSCSDNRAVLVASLNGLGSFCLVETFVAISLFEAAGDGLLSVETACFALGLVAAVNQKAFVERGPMLDIGCSIAHYLWSFPRNKCASNKTAATPRPDTRPEAVLLVDVP